MRATDPVYRDRRFLGWILTRYDDVAAVLRDPRVSSLRPTANEPVGRALASIESEVRELREFQSRWMMYLDPPDHTRLRSLVSSGIHGRDRRSMRGRIQALVNELLAPAREAGKLDVVQDLARPLPALVIADLIGMPREDRKTFQAWSDGIAAGMVLSTRGQDAIDGLKEAHRSQRELIAYFGTLVASRRVQPREDLLSALIASEVDGNILDDAELIAMCVLVLGLGRPQELRLLAACREDPRVRIAARCSSADEVLAAIQERGADVILVDEDLHLLDDEHVGYLGVTETPTIVLSREPNSERWQTSGRLMVLPADADAAEILTALAEVGRHQRQRGPRGGAELMDPQPAAVQAVGRPGYLQVLAFWSGPGSPGRTTVAINWGTLLGWVARTVIVDLNLSGAAVTAQLDQTPPDIARRGFVGSSILQLASANPASPDNWLHEVFRVARPLGPLSPHTDSQWPR